MMTYFELCDMAGAQGYNTSQLPYVESPAVRSILEYYTAEVTRLREALQSIIDVQPNPTLPYGVAVIEIAREALSR